MNAVVGGLRRQAESVRDWVLREILRQQKPELDRKIDQMLKPPKVNRITTRYLRIGASFGRKMSSRGLGRRVGGMLKRLARLL